MEVDGQAADQATSAADLEELVAADDDSADDEETPREEVPGDARSQEAH